MSLDVGTDASSVGAALPEGRKCCPRCGKTKGFRAYTAEGRRNMTVPCRMCMFGASGIKKKVPRQNAVLSPRELTAIRQTLRCLECSAFPQEYVHQVRGAEEPTVRVETRHFDWCVSRGQGS